MKCTAPRSARLLAQMRERGYEVSLDLVSRKGDPRYRPLVLPALKHLDYLASMNWKPASLAGWRFVYPTASRTSPISPAAASALLDAGVRSG
ncbi:kinase [Klebsiella pneumoniae subsp. pneumoniae]|nr:kinase [Klebsiella pneumoniae subsp. pneumoniae]